MNCKNCNTELNQQDDYCKSCGGRVIRNRLSFRNLFEHISETFFNYDNKLLRTLIDLFRKPEAVIDGYITGTRKRYVNPISFFGLSLTLTGLLVFIIGKFYKDVLNPASLYQNGQDEATKIMTNFTTDFTLQYASFLFSLFIPIAALLALILFFKKKYNYTEHIVLSLYSLSLYSITSSLLGILILLISPNSYFNFGILMYVFVLIYHSYIYKRIFHLSYGQIILKIVLFLILFFITFFGIIILIVIIMFITGDMQQLIEAQKAAMEAAKQT